MQGILWFCDNTSTVAMRTEISVHFNLKNSGRNFRKGETLTSSMMYLLSPDVPPKSYLMWECTTALTSTRPFSGGLHPTSTSTRGDCIPSENLFRIHLFFSLILRFIAVQTSLHSLHRRIRPTSWPTTAINCFPIYIAPLRPLWWGNRRYMSGHSTKNCCTSYL